MYLLNLAFRVDTEAIIEHDDGNYLWFHPRVAMIPRAGIDGNPAALMTLQRHLQASDHYTGLYFMRSDDLGSTWTQPELPVELDWRVESESVDIAVVDVTPIFHAPSGKVIAIGAEVRYDKNGKPLDDIPRAFQTAYAIYDPETGDRTPWRRLEMPLDEKFNFAQSANAQCLVQSDGTLLLPFYIGEGTNVRWRATVIQASFDGHELKFIQHGTELSLNVDRGLYEPNLAFFQGRYYLTMRSNQRAYVSVSDDGLNFQPIKAWRFDDGQELGSYNTQQRWLVHSDGLFLVCTRRGANNDHIYRHRAPLFLA